MKKIALCCLFLLGLKGFAYCGQISKIELSDGSVIQAEVVSLEKGTYTLHTNSLGEVKIPASEIRKIGMPNLTPDSVVNNSEPSNSTPKSKTGQLKTSITNNPEIMATMVGMLSDPQFQEILKDPEIMNAVKTENVKALQANEKFMRVINHPKIKEIEGKLKE